MRAGLLLLILGIVIVGYGYTQLEKGTSVDNESDAVEEEETQAPIDMIGDSFGEVEEAAVTEKEIQEKEVAAPVKKAAPKTTTKTSIPKTSTTKPAPVRQTTVVAQPGTSFIVISYDSNGFYPHDITADPGTTLQFVNMVTMPLWVTANGIESVPAQFYPEFDQGKSVPQGGSFSIILYDQGDWKFKNLNNSKHTGTVRIR